jgi:hypothetical protein
MKGKMTTSELIKTVSNITLDNIDAINKLVGNLNEDQLKWRPDQGFWNISEVLSCLQKENCKYSFHLDQRSLFKFSFGAFCVEINEAG